MKNNLEGAGVAAAAFSNSSFFILIQLTWRIHDIRCLISRQKSKSAFISFSVQIQTANVGSINFYEFLRDLPENYEKYS